MVIFLAPLSFDNAHLGSLLYQLLQIVNCTYVVQVEVVAEAMPSMINLLMAGMVLGQIVGNADFTQARDVLNSSRALSS